MNYSSGTSITELVLYDTACSNSWSSDSLSARLGLQGTALKLIGKCIKAEVLLNTKVVLLTQHLIKVETSKRLLFVPMWEK